MRTARTRRRAARKPATAHAPREGTEPAARTRSSAAGSLRYDDLPRSDVVRGRRLDLAERRARPRADPDADPVADRELAGRDERRHPALPADEDGPPAVGERLVLRLTEHRHERPVIALEHVEAEVPVRGGRAQRALEEPERLPRMTWTRAVISDDCCGRRLDLGQRRAARSANADRQLITLCEVALLDDG